ncbi:hypothetical protein P7C70_g8544, partial [Phenoliferia sp. Uapishka_3]
MDELMRAEVLRRAGFGPPATPTSAPLATTDNSPRNFAAAARSFAPNRAPRTLSNAPRTTIDSSLDQRMRERQIEEVRKKLDLAPLPQSTAHSATSGPLLAVPNEPGTRHKRPAPYELDAARKKAPSPLEEVVQHTTRILSRAHQRTLDAIDDTFYSIYNIITFNNDSVPAARRCHVAEPPAGTPRRASSGHVWSETSNAQRALALMVGGGKASMEGMGYALKCFHTWATMEKVPDHLRFPLHTEVAERYVQSLVGRYSSKTIKARITKLQAWHQYHNVKWEVDPACLVFPIKTAVTLQPHKKLKRDPLLSAHLKLVLPRLNLNNSFDLCFRAAVLVGHRGLLRTAEFLSKKTNPADHDRKRLMTASRVKKKVTATGVVVGLELHLPWDKVSKGQGAIATLLPIPDDPTCPVVALRDHLERNKVGPDEFTFTYTSSIGNRAGKRTMMTKDAFMKHLNYILVDLLKLDPLKGHSLRIGGATQMLMNGIPPMVVQAIGRWASDSFMVYWRHITAILSAQQMAHKIVDAPLLEDLYYQRYGSEQDVARVFIPDPFSPTPLVPIQDAPNASALDFFKPHPPSLSETSQELLLSIFSGLYSTKILPEVVLERNAALYSCVSSSATALSKMWPGYSSRTPSHPHHSYRFKKLQRSGAAKKSNDVGSRVKLAEDRLAVERSVQIGECPIAADALASFVVADVLSRRGVAFFPPLVKVVDPLIDRRFSRTSGDLASSPFTLPSSPPLNGSDLIAAQKRASASVLLPAIFSTISPRFPDTIKRIPGESQTTVLWLHKHSPFGQFAQLDSSVHQTDDANFDSAGQEQHKQQQHRSSSSQRGTSSQPFVRVVACAAQQLEPLGHPLREFRNTALHALMDSLPVMPTLSLPSLPSMPSFSFSTPSISCLGPDSSSSGDDSETERPPNTNGEKDIKDDPIKRLSGNVVVLGGYRGSILREAKTGKRIWIPLRVGFGLRKPDLSIGFSDEDELRSRETVVPGKMLMSVGGVIDLGKRLKDKL